VIAAGDQPAPAGVTVDEGSRGRYEGPILMDSTVPLRTEDSSGREEAVDLGLERTEGELQPANPLVEVGIPNELGEGIEVAESGVRIELGGAPAERSPSVIDQSVAAYPEVARDTSFAVAPSPTGLETMTLLQSSDAPRSETVHLDLPNGDSLRATSEGGAEVVQSDGRTLMSVLPPTALDADGRRVPVSLDVSGNSLSLHVSPQDSNAWPILVDPVFETYSWFNNKSTAGLADWTSASTTNIYLSSNYANCGVCPSPLTSGMPGLYIGAGSGSVAPGSLSNWTYQVPRWSSDWAQYNAAPTSFVSSMTLQGLGVWTGADHNASPYMVTGIWDAVNGQWPSSLWRGGNEGDLTNFGTTYNYPGNNDQNAKQAAVVIYSPETHSLSAYRQIYVGDATINLGDTGAPSFASISSPTQWVNNQPTAPIGFTVSDSGLGVYSLEASSDSIPKSARTTLANCAGVASNPCPHTWKSTDASRPALAYDPSILPQGANTLKVVARDPLGNTSSPSYVQVKVDHTAPSLTLSGSMMQQASLGTSRPRYILNVSASDGTVASPQSGVASTKITVDGKQVDSTAAGCATQNCAVSREWILNSSSYSVGKHVVAATAIDSVGLATTKELVIEIQRDTTQPIITTGGALFAAPEGWVEQKNYSSSVQATDSQGYGLNSLVLKIDGKTVKTITNTCPDGGCESLMSPSVDTTQYSGGAHPVEILATDGAGNTAVKSWTMNVNPKGEISSTEATQTLEATESTSETTTVASTNEVISTEEQADGNDPALKYSGGKLQSSGIPTVTSIATEPKGGFTVEGPEGAITAQPVQVTTGATSVAVANGAASVSANTNNGVDSVIRPIYDGAMTFQEIRAATSPEEYSWEVELASGQKLLALDSQTVELQYGDGSRAMTISAETAHDATGTAVPTTLSLSAGRIITLTVAHHSGTFVYPILAGPSWEASYLPVVITDPPSPVNELSPPVSAPEQTTPPTIFPDSAINSRYIDRPVPPPNVVDRPNNTRSSEASAEYCSSLSCGTWDIWETGRFFWNGRAAWRDNGAPLHCQASSHPVVYHDVEIVNWAGPNPAPYGNGRHLNLYCNTTIGFLAPENWISEDKQIQDHLYGDGYQGRHIKAVGPLE